MSKPTLLLLPGLLCDATVWEMQARDLALQADCRVANYGSLDSLTAMARHVLAMAPGEDFALAGHSMGGRVALEVVRLAPHRVCRLALLDTGYQPLAAGAAGEQERAAGWPCWSTRAAPACAPWAEPGHAAWYIRECWIRRSSMRSWT